MEKRDQESDILERLNEAATARGFFIATVEIFDEAVDRLVQRVFRKDDFAVKYAVEPLLHHAGPLGDLSVRLKLVYGIGLISQPLYQDIEGLIRLRDFLNSVGSEFTFTSPEILKPIKELNTVQEMGVVQLDIAPPEDDTDIAFYNMQRARQEQVIRSALALAVASICSQLSKDNPLL